MSIQSQSHLLTLAKGHLHIKFKILINGPGHMTKMAAMPIYVVKSFKNQLLPNGWTVFNETWYEALGALTLHSLVYINHDLGLALTY